MSFDKEQLNNRVKKSISRISRYSTRFEDNEIEDSSETGFRSLLARNYKKAALAASMLENQEDSREWFKNAANNHVIHVRQERENPEPVDTINFENHPSIIIRAIDEALIAGAEPELREALSVVPSFSAEFLEQFDFEDSPYRFYNVQVLAAIIRRSPDQEALLDSLRDAVEPLDDSLLDQLVRVYQGFVDADETTLRTEFPALVEAYGADTDDDPEYPDDYISTTITALLALAYHQGYDVEVESEYVLNCLLPPAETRSHRHARVCSHITDARVTIEDQDDGPLVTCLLDHPGDRDITLDDLPADEHGTVLTEKWLDGTIERLRESDVDEAQALGETLAEEREEGEIRRQLVAYQAASDPHLIDESIGDLDLNDVDLQKGR
ncbi:immunity 49 family protein [Halobacteria archaeon HArc-gm2]|nr:immunity 49 family protein [Halobacteria archaeon HArc-gm2]